MSICNTSFETEASTSKVKKKKKGIEGKKGDPKNYGGEKQISTPENRPRKRRK